MVGREELLADLFHLLVGTHWPTDKTNSTLARNGANRVPKPPRTPASSTTATPLRQNSISSSAQEVSSAPLASCDSSKLSDDEDIGCIDWDSLISSLDPNLNMEVQSQYNQLCPDPPSLDLTPKRKQSLSSKKTSSNWSVGHSMASIRQSALALSSTHAKEPSEVLASKTQQVILLLLCEAFQIAEDEKESLCSAAALRKVSKFSII